MERPLGAAFLRGRGREFSSLGFCLERSSEPLRRSSGVFLLRLRARVANGDTDLRSLPQPPDPPPPLDRPDPSNAVPLLRGPGAPLTPTGAVQHDLGAGGELPIQRGWPPLS